MSKIKNLVPSPIKEAVRRSLKNMLGLDTMVHRIQTLEETVLALSPEIIPRSDDLNKAIKGFLIKNNFSTFNANISKHDLMYLNLYQGSKQREQAYMDYLRSGLFIMRVLEAVIRHKFGGFDKVDALLDFASGYGRLTRFLVQVMEPERIWVSDIKAGAMEFQQQQFGVKTVVSSVMPEDFRIDKHFDCIYVVSLFSHLPEETFQRWLQRLCDLLSSNGVLIFTVHDVGLRSSSHAKDSNDFTYRRASEETSLFNVDSPLETEHYGTAYVSEAFIRKVIQQLNFANKRCFRYERGMEGHQDIYILAKNSADDFSNLELPKGYS